MNAYYKETEKPYGYLLVDNKPGTPPDKQILARANGNKIYNFFCTTERFKNSPLVHAINEYNFKLDK